MTNNTDHLTEAAEFIPDTPSSSTVVPKSPRYVGRITLGVALIFVGVVITLSLFLPGQRILFLIQLLPLILVALGVEVLVSSSRHKDRPVKVGFGLTLLSLLLIAGSVFSAMVPVLWENYGPPYQNARSAREQALEDDIYSVLDRSLLDRVSVSAPPEGFLDNPTAIAYIDLMGDYADEAAFAETVAPMVQALSGMGLENLSFRTSNTTDTWSLELVRALIQSDTAPEELAPRVRHERFYLNEYGSMVSTEAEVYDEMVEQGLLVSADGLKQARQEGWNEGYQQGVSDLREEQEPNDSANLS